VDRLALVLVIWPSTAFLQVPRHGELSRGFDGDARGRLCRTNWFWTADRAGRGDVLFLFPVLRGEG
jgi:hypothetical protein